MLIGAPAENGLTFTKVQTIIAAFRRRVKVLTCGAEFNRVRHCFFIQTENEKKNTSSTSGMGPRRGRDQFFRPIDSDTVPGQANGNAGNLEKGRLERDRTGQSDKTAQGKSKERHIIHG